MFKPNLPFYAAPKDTPPGGTPPAAPPAAPPAPPEPPKGDEAPTWAKAIQEGFSSLTSRLTALEQRAPEAPTVTVPVPPPPATPPAAPAAPVKGFLARLW